MSDVRIRLLGDLDVAVDGWAVDAFESQSARALLARLAVDPGRALPRAMLAELLWPDRPEGAASGNLRHCLAALRRSIGDDDTAHPVLVATRSTIGLAEDVSVDLTEFVRLSSVAATAPGASQPGRLPSLCGVARSWPASTCPRARRGTPGW